MSYFVIIEQTAAGYIARSADVAGPAGSGATEAEAVERLRQQIRSLTACESDCPAAGTAGTALADRPPHDQVENRVDTIRNDGAFRNDAGDHPRNSIMLVGEHQ
jgi:hypothetical protein